MEQKPLNQEIDLLQLFAKVIRTLKRNWIVVILSPLIGAFLGVLLFIRTNKNIESPDQIKSKMMISTDLISERESIFLCDDLSASKHLPGITKEQQSKIITITCETARESTNKDRYASTITITATLSDSTLFPIIQKSVVDYFSQSEPVVRCMAERNELYLRLIEELERESKVVKTLNHPYTSFLDAMYPYRLFEKKVNYELYLKNEMSIHVVKGFGTFVKFKETSIAGHSIFFYAFTGLTLGIIALVFILFIRFFIQYYKHFELTHP